MSEIRVLTRQEIEAIRERCDKATAGIWDSLDDTFVIEGDGLIMGDLVAKCERIEDADFIANARQDIPRLLEYIEMLEAMNVGSCKDALERINSTHETDNEKLAYVEMIKNVLDREYGKEVVFYDKGEWYSRYYCRNITIDELAKFLYDMTRKEDE